MTVPYRKPALTFTQQADLLLSRGLKADRDLLIQRLSEVNYYRLSAYWYPFRNTEGDGLIPGTKFETIWRRYTFDRQLRLLAMDGIERIEVSVKTKMVNFFGLKFGAFGHLDLDNFKPDVNVEKHRILVEELRNIAKKSQEIFVRHSQEKYKEFPDLPLWKACEIMTFGNFLSMYRLIERNIQVAIAKQYGLPGTVFTSWLFTINYIRNLCAHHCRLWNRQLAIEPKIPKQKDQPGFHPPFLFQKNRVFTALTMCKYMLSFIAPQSSWQQRLKSLLDDYPEIPLRAMGFPENWQDSPIWQ